MILREAVAHDAIYIRTLLDQLGYVFQDEKEVLQKILLHQQDGYAMLVAVENQKVVGFIALHWMEVAHRHGKLGRITAMCIEEGVRSKGIGAAMVREAETIFRSQDCRTVEVTSNLRRGRAHAFYLRQGYVETSKRFVKTLS